MSSWTATCLQLYCKSSPAAPWDPPPLLRRWHSALHLLHPPIVSHLLQHLPQGISSWRQDPAHCLQICPQCSATYCQQLSPSALKSLQQSIAQEIFCNKFASVHFQLTLKQHIFHTSHNIHFHSCDQNTSVAAPAPFTSSAANPSQEWDLSFATCRKYH